MKFLAEPLTNSDDSYERLENSGEVDIEDVKLIRILLNRNIREISIIDHAEGMTEQSVRKIFSSYGADTSRNTEVTSVRGMFGQGATDVLFAAAIDNLTARIITVKDQVVTEANFYLNNSEREFRIEDDPPELSVIRTEFGIPKNGTIFTFGVPSEVTIPMTKNLIENLSNFYMLRFLFSKQNRRVVLVDKNKGEEYIIKYNFENYNSLDVLSSEQFQFEYEKKKLNARIELRFNPDKRPEDGLLIFEDRIVLDNQFFDRKNAPGMDKIEGTLQLEGALEIIRELLNAEKPEEIITDSRDGFSRSHDFYKILRKHVEPYLIKAGSLVTEKESNSGEGLKSSTVYRDIFKEINKLMREELEEIPGSSGSDDSMVPPIEGMRFVRPKINISVGKQYFLKLIVNTQLIKPDEVIDFKYKSKAINLKSKFLVVPKSDQNPVMLDVFIEGLGNTFDPVLLTAESNDYSANLFVNVVEKSLHYPKYGLEFHPDEMFKKPGTNVVSHLYINLEKYPLGTEIQFASSLENISVINRLVVVVGHKLTEEIAMIPLEIRGGIEGGDCTITAKAKNYEARLTVHVREKEQPNLNKTGYVNDINKEATTPFVQSYYDSSKGIIFINTRNQENNVFLKSWFEGKELNNEQSKFVADLASTEIAKLILKKKYEKGKLDITDLEVVIDELQKEKQKIFGVFIKSV